MYEPIASPKTWEGQIIGNWSLEQRLGEGGMSFVYVGHHQERDQRGAVKVLRAELCEDESAIERFRREAMAASQLNHPNIVKVLDSGSEEGLGHFIVLELLDGQELEDFVSKPQPIEWLYSIMEQICSALIATHEAGIVHRDLKPSNVFLIPAEPYPEVKLLDFGIAKLPEVDRKLTQTGVLVGTPSSVAPEQLAQQSDLITPGVDIYATGVLLYLLLTGKLPIHHKNLADQLMAVFNEIPLPVGDHRPELKSTELEALVAQLLAKSPAERPATMREVWDKLSRAFQALPGVSLRQDRATVMEARTQASRAPLPTVHEIVDEGAGPAENLPALGTIDDRGQGEALRQHEAAASGRRRTRLDKVENAAPERPHDQRRAPLHNARPPLPTGDEEILEEEPLLPDLKPAARPSKAASSQFFWIFFIVFAVGVIGGAAYVFWKQQIRRAAPPLEQRRAAPARAAPTRAKASNTSQTPKTRGSQTP